MSIQSEIDRIKTAVTASKEKLIGKGVSVASDFSVDDIPSEIDKLEKPASLIFNDRYNKGTLRIVSTGFPSIFQYEPLVSSSPGSAASDSYLKAKRLNGIVLFRCGSDYTTTFLIELFNIKAELNVNRPGFLYQFVNSNTDGLQVQPCGVTVIALANGSYGLKFDLYYNFSGASIVAKYVDIAGYDQ